jgi:cobalt-zinc-cadmium efflux system protein
VEHLLSRLEGVIEVQQLHIWAISSSRVALTAHLRCRSTATASSSLLRQAEQQLKALGIEHSTLQLESDASAGQRRQVG